MSPIWLLTFAFGLGVLYAAIRVLNRSELPSHQGAWVIAFWVGFFTTLISAIPIVLSIIEWVVRTFNLPLFF